MNLVYVSPWTYVMKWELCFACNKTLEHVADHYILFIMIGQFSCFAHQNRGFWWAKQAHWPIMVKMNVMVCHMF